MVLEMIFQPIKMLLTEGKHWPHLISHKVLVEGRHFHYPFMRPKWPRPVDGDKQVFVAGIHLQLSFPALLMAPTLLWLIDRHLRHLLQRNPPHILVNTPILHPIFVLSFQDPTINTNFIKLSWTALKWDISHCALPAWKSGTIGSLWTKGGWCFFASYCGETCKAV